jgi:hypothetical protein
MNNGAPFAKATQHATSPRLHFHHHSYPSIPLGVFKIHLQTRITDPPTLSFSACCIHCSNADRTANLNSNDLLHVKLSAQAFHEVLPRWLINALYV